METVVHSKNLINPTGKPPLRRSTPLKSYPGLPGASNFWPAVFGGFQWERLQRGTRADGKDRASPRTGEVVGVASSSFGCGEGTAALRVHRLLRPAAGAPPVSKGQR